MIVGYTFFGIEDGIAYDTPLPTSQLDNMKIGEGLYDEIYMSVDNTIPKDNVRQGWDLKTLINPKFQNDLEAGTIDADGHIVTQLQLYRRELTPYAEWILIGQTDYTQEYNVYSFVDNTAESGKKYEYAIAPVANEIIGELNISEEAEVRYDGVFISDTDHNFKIELNAEQDIIEYNRNYTEHTPLNGKFPISVFGKQDYRTSKLTFLPVSETQRVTSGTDIDGRDERTIRDKVTSFLNNGKAKILRNDNGDIMIVATHGVQSQPISDNLPDIQSVSFNYTEVGKIEEDGLAKTNLLNNAVKSRYSYDEYGTVVWDI